MNEARLRSLLQDAPIPDSESAERRGLAMVSEAFAQQRPARRNPLPRIALAVAIATLLAALLLSPAGAAVRDWVGDVFTAGVPNAESGLTEIPGGGQLLVQTPAGPWVVQPDGSRRLLGRYDEATWSPRGLFVAGASGHSLSAIEPDGTPHWSLSTAVGISDPRWSPSGFQIAYRAGPALRVVAGDGSDELLIDPRVGPVPAAWSPQGLPLLAYVGADGTLRVANAESAEMVGSTAALPGIVSLEWAAGGSTLLEASRASLRLRSLNARKPIGGLEIGPGRQIPLPAGSAVLDAALSPDGETIAALLSLGAAGPPRTEVALVNVRSGARRPLFSTPGRLSELTWSPDGSRLLISWRDADQWLFIPVDGRGRVRAIGNVAGEFAPGNRNGAFPRIEGWCCAQQPGA